MDKTIIPDGGQNARGLDEMKSIHRRGDFTSAKRGFHLRSRFHPPERVDFTEKSTCFRKCFFLVGEDGFEPSKRNAADLQSVPFGHSGTPPDIRLIRKRNFDIIPRLEKKSREKVRNGTEYSRKLGQGGDQENQVWRMARIWAS